MTQFNVHEPFDVHDAPKNNGLNVLNLALTLSKLFLVGVNAIVFLFIVYITKRQQTQEQIDRIVKKKQDEKERNIGIVIAHPDDEAMFMTPTLISLSNQADIRVYLICLSTGNANGIGKQRVKELAKSCKALSISNAEEIDEITRPSDLANTNKNIIIVDHSELQDGMKTKWNTKIISEFVSAFVKRYEIDSVSTNYYEGLIFEDYYI
jgi:N-acetylglucosaminylphosphatidylinositol deacetylase